MYNFQTNSGRRKSKHLIHLLYVIIFILIIALAGLAFSYSKSLKVSDATSSALLARALTEANEAQSAVYRLTQSSGTNTMTLLSTIRGHIRSLQAINGIASSIYGAGTVIVEEELLSVCQSTISECETRMQAGSVLTTTFTTLRDQVDAVAATFSGTI